MKEPETLPLSYFVQAEHPRASQIKLEDSLLQHCFGPETKTRKGITVCANISLFRGDLEWCKISKLEMFGTSGLEEKEQKGRGRIPVGHHLTENQPVFILNFFTSTFSYINLALQAILAEGSG